MDTKDDISGPNASPIAPAVTKWLEAVIRSARDTWSAMYRREIPRGPPKPVSILPKKINSGELNCSAVAYRKFPAVSMIKLAMSGCLKERFVHTLWQSHENE
jgi:hypothetical protein